MILTQILFDEYYDDVDEGGEFIIPGKEKDRSKSRYHNQDEEDKIRHRSALYGISCVL